MKKQRNNQWKKVIITTVASATLFTPISNLILEAKVYASDEENKGKAVEDDSESSIIDSSSIDSSNMESTSSDESNKKEEKTETQSNADSSVVLEKEEKEEKKNEVPQTEENTYDPALIRQQAIDLMNQEQPTRFKRSLRVNNQQEFINKIADYAVGHAKSYGLYASVMIAQAIVESAWGGSGLSIEPNNNLFGIKGAYNGQSVYFWTTEYVNGEYIQVYAAFRKYPSYKESLEDNAKLLRYGLTSNSSFYNGTWLENTNSYQDATQWLQGRYATDPNYARTLNSIIAMYSLDQYDNANGVSIKEITDVNLKAKVAVNSEKYNIPVGNHFIEKVPGTVNSVLEPRGYLTDIAKKAVTNNGKTFYLATINGGGFCWIAEENLTFYEDVTSVESINMTGMITSDSPRYRVPDGLKRIEKLTMTTASLSSKVVQISHKLVTSSGVTYYAIRQNGQGICWIPADKLQLSEPAGNQKNVSLAGLLKNGARKYRIAELGHIEPLDLTTDDMVNKSVKIIKEVQSNSGATYYLITNSNGQPICWILESDLILSEVVSSTQGYNNGGLVVSAARKYSLQ